MKLIALKDFRNVAALGLKQDGKSKIKDAIHDDHIHKGAQFEIGSGKDLAALHKNEPGTAQIVAQLFVSKCVGDASDSEVVKAVQAEVEVDKKREANAKKIDQAAADAAFGRKVLENLDPENKK